MMERSWTISVALIVIAGAVSTSHAGTVHPDLLLQLGSLNPEEEISVIVTLTDQQNLQQFTDRDKKLQRLKIARALRDRADKTQKPLREFLRKKNVRKITPFWIFNGMAVTIRADQVSELAKRPEVRSLRLDGTLTLPQPSPSVAAGPEWNLNAINAPSLWELGYTGTGVVVASMDTGVDYLHPDIGPKWRGGANSWYDPNGEHDAPYDRDGHGTQTMGVMVGGDAGGTSIGVAPGAVWIAAKVFNDAGIATESSIHLGFQWLLDPDGNPDTDDLPDVVNISWGVDERVNECYSVYQPDILALKTAEVAVVVSAGNSGPSLATSISPANYPESFAVGSVDETLQVASSSSRGPSACDGTLFPEIVAPGVNVRTADLTTGGIIPNSYVSVSGTSFAAPHVAGAMALMLSVDPQLTVAEIETALMQSAADKGDPGTDNAYGYGLLDVRAAYNRFTPFPWSLFVPAITGRHKQ